MDRLANGEGWPAGSPNMLRKIDWVSSSRMASASRRLARSVVSAVQDLRDPPLLLDRWQRHGEDPRRSSVSIAVIRALPVRTCG